jgi:serine/threonine-protein kinase
VDIGPQADIYGLGATLYHMVTGSVPFKGKNPSEVMHRHLKEPLVAPDHLNPGISSGLAQIIEMMMAKDPSDRYRNAAELLDDLDLVEKGQKPRHAGGAIDLSSMVSGLGSDGQPVDPPVVVPAAGSRTQSNGLTLAIIAGLAISLLINLALLAWISGQAN